VADEIRERCVDMLTLAESLLLTLAAHRLSSGHALHGRIGVSVADCCSVLQCVAVCCSVLQFVVVRCSALQCVAVRYSVLQCVAVCYSVLQCVAVSSGHALHGCVGV